MNLRSNLALFCLLSSAFTNQAFGAILFTTGSMLETTPLLSFVGGDTESSTEILIAFEGTTVLPIDIFVNAVGPGTFTGSSFPATTISAGTTVHSYFVHFDPLGGAFTTLTGSVFFEPGETILGIQTHTPLLDGADPAVGGPGTYPTGIDAFRAFETLPGTDTVTIAPGLGSASFTFFAELGVDQGRIITTTAPIIPVPAAVWLFGGALGALGVVRRRAKSA